MKKFFIILALFVILLAGCNGNLEAETSTSEKETVTIKSDNGNVTTNTESETSRTRKTPNTQTVTNSNGESLFFGKNIDKFCFFMSEEALLNVFEKEKILFRTVDDMRGEAAYYITENNSNKISFGLDWNDEVRQSREVTCISVASPEYTTAEGAKVGDDISKIRQIYGDTYTEHKDDFGGLLVDWEYFDGEIYLLFSFSDGKVVSSWMLSKESLYSTTG